MKHIQKLFQVEFFKSISKKSIFTSIAFLFFMVGMFYAAGRLTIGLGALLLGTAFFVHPLAISLRGYSKIEKYFLVSLGVFFVYTGSSIFWAQNTSQALSFFLILYCFALVFLSLLRATNQERVLSLKTVALVSVTTTLYGLYEFFSVSGGGLVRIGSFFQYPNAYAALAFIGFGIASIFFIQSISLKYRKGIVSWGLVGIVSFVGFVLSLSRGGWLAAAVATLCTVYLVRKKVASVHARAWIGAALAVCLAVSFSVWNIKKIIVENTGQSLSMVRSEETKDENAASYRKAYWKDAVRMAGLHPFGVGAGNYEDAIRHQKDVLSYYAADPHSFPLRMVSEMGIGSVFLFTFFICFFVALHRKKLAYTENTSAAILFGLTLFFFLHASIDTHMRYPIMWLVLAVLMGSTYSYTKDKNKEPLSEYEDSSGSRIFSTIAILIVLGAGVWLVYVGYMGVQSSYLEEESGRQQDRLVFAKKAAYAGRVFGPLWLDAAQASFYAEQARTSIESERDYTETKLFITRAEQYRGEFFANDRLRMMVAVKERDLAAYTAAGENARIHNPRETLAEQASLVNMYLSTGKSEKALVLANEMYIGALPYFTSRQFRGDEAKIQKISSVAQAQGMVYIHAKSVQNTVLMQEIQARIENLTRLAKSV